VGKHNKIFRGLYSITPEKALRFSIGIILILVAISGILLYFWEVNLISYFPKVSLCPFHALTGKPCPGCGMSRAFLLLGQFKIKEAVELNLFSLPLLFLMIIYFYLGYIPVWLQNRVLVHITLSAVFIFWIIRFLNI